MSAAKNKDAAGSAKGQKVAALWGWLLFGPPRGLTWSAIALLAFAAFSWGLWQRVGPQVVAGDDYTIGPRDVDITALPNWIHGDLAADVVRGLSMDAPLSILDDSLTQRMHDAFSAQPWVAKVERVSKQHPARVRVDLIYRRPVGMVQTNPVPLPGSKAELPARLLPIDAQGTLLPERDFSEPQRQQYPRLAGISSAPPAVAGTRWADGRVTGGAQIAAALIDVWKELSLAVIVASPQADTSLEQPEYTFEIFTDRGTRIAWGHAPDTRMPGVVPVSEKVARLKRLKQQNGTLDGTDGSPQQIDVHYWHHARVTPGAVRTAVRPEGGQGATK